MEEDAVRGRSGEKGVHVKLVLLTMLVLFACVASSASSQGVPPMPPCTAGASSVVYGQAPVTTWDPPGCAHP
jgi:hypothetical protein